MALYYAALQHFTHSKLELSIEGQTSRHWRGVGEVYIYLYIYRLTHLSTLSTVLV